MPTIHLICGLPGSGKSTLAKELERKHRAFRFTPDSWLIKIVGNGNDERARAAVESIQWELAKKALSLGVDVILEFGFWSRSERIKIRQTAKTLGAKSQLHYLEVSIDELKSRITCRNMNLPDDCFFVDPSNLEKWYKEFEIPSPDELEQQ